MSCYKPVTSAMVMAFLKFATAVGLVVAAVLPKNFGKLVVPEAEKRVLQTAFACNICNILFEKVSNSKDGKGFQDVTGCRFGANAVTKCYRVVTSCNI